MKRFFTRHGIIILSAAAAVAVILALVSFFSSNTDLLTNIVNTVSSPFRSAASSVSGWFEGQLRYREEFDALKEENQALREQIAQMEEDLRQAQEDSQENERLRQLLNLQEQERSFTYRIAKVTQQDSSNWSAVLTLGVGADQEVEIGDCVVTETHQLVGVITDVGSNWSSCTTLIDTDFSIGAAIFRTGDAGLAQGDFNQMQEGLLHLNYLDADAAPQVGDLVVTSGVGGYYPDQLVIGRVQEVMTDDDGLAQYAVLAPAADLDALQQVFIITDFTIAE